MKSLLNLKKYSGQTFLFWSLVFISFYQGNAGVKEKRGLFPDLINLASSAIITANATCGKRVQEFYCKLTEHAGHREPQCGVCDARSPDPSRRHPPENAVDGTSSWWQSPTLAHGPEYEWITITLDLRQVYQVAYVIVKSAISPRPGNWILERSLDGTTYQPWQYYATSDSECATFYNMEATKGRPRYKSDDDVICTSYFSKLNPLEGGEVHTSLVNGRPGASGPSEALRKFTEARYVRLRLQKIRTLHGDLQGRFSDNDPSVSRRYFYSIKDISIGGRCVCNGHADSCDLVDGQQRCACSHNTCGAQCDRCCPLFNQYLWRRGKSNDGAICEQCQCNKHADACKYDPEVHEKKLSVNIDGRYKGGGVCLECRHFTTGINCEKCKLGYYRPKGILPDDPRPCIPCSCESPGATGKCISDDSQANLGRPPGSCVCKRGFKGSSCNECSEGYLKYPKCEPCPCSRAGSKNKACEGDCICKENVMGPRCDTCVPGTFHLDEYYVLGCTSCFCNGATDKCEAARLAVYTISERGYWQVTDLLHRRVIAAVESETSVSVAREDMTSFSAYFWLAPKEYLGERLTSYGQTLTVKSSWVNLRGDTSGTSTRCPDVILEGGRYKIAYGGQYYRGRNSVLFEIPFYEQGWYHFPKDLGDILPDMPLEKYQLGSVTRKEMMEVLSSLKILMIRARFHTEQVESILHNVILEYGKEGADRTEATLATGAVERCFCPPGYSGLSCESCELGYRRVDNIIFGGKCLSCQCNGHVQSCDPFTGSCGKCLHNTFGDHCERCAAGYYGDPSRGTPDDCKPCQCPLPLGQNEFTPSCVPDLETESFKCLCPRGYEGPRCERCADGYFGNSMIPGHPCKTCDCSGNVDPRARGNCDRVTGQCLKCLGNTAGFRCEKCKENHYGDPKRGQCLTCGCHEIGSHLESCDPKSGQCQCKALYAGRQCDHCVSGRGGVTDGCPPCRCDRRGSVTDTCDPVTGQCPCKPGVGGRHCDRCLENHFGDIGEGCNRKNLRIINGEEDETKLIGESENEFSKIGVKDTGKEVVWGENRNKSRKINDIGEKDISDQTETRNQHNDKLKNSILDFYRDAKNSGQNRPNQLSWQPKSKNTKNNSKNQKKNPKKFLRKKIANETKMVKFPNHEIGETVEGERGENVNSETEVVREGRKADYAVIQRWHYKVTQKKERVSTKVAKTPHEIATKVSSETYGRTHSTMFEFPERFHGSGWGSQGGQKTGGGRSRWGTAAPGGRRKLRIGHKYPDTFKNWRGLVHGCDCDDRGSQRKTCDIVTGQCQCRRNVIGRTCNSCRPGYWGISVSGECQKCACDVAGTLDGQCDDRTGHCQCRPGIGGPECARCLPGFWGFSNIGCKPCEPCNFPGRNCDLKTGRCVCPPNTGGDKCERCSQGFWDYSADIGCRPCRCSGPGSLERQCDPRTGRCVCRGGYEGNLCNKCSYGYFGYPRCQSCNCHRAGTDPRLCREEGRCQCDENGRCPCKPNVRGIRCGKCTEGTFGLSIQNLLGCFQCFCFKKSGRCEQADLTWSQLPQFRPRHLIVEFKTSISSSVSTSSSSSAESQIIIRPWNTQEICYINLALPGERRLQLSEDETRLNITNQLYVIPNTDGDITIGTSLPFLAPLYWQLPKEFMRDKTRSYNGLLRFTVQTSGNKKTFPEQILQSYPLVSLQGNWQLVLEYYPPSIAKDGRYEVRFHEDLWRLKNNPQKVTREQMMIALQNVQHILIRATHSDDFTSATLSDVTLEVATEGTPVSSRKAHGIELCFCPESYSGSSCQNPNIGFFRWYKENHIQSTIIIDLVGESKPCQCNGRANVCDQETGVCKNCRENTSGTHCEVCATGYYGEPNRGRCKPCACPSRQQNFASTCQADPYSEYICHCRKGYTGNKCERCAEGYYGNPAELGGSCEACNCDPNGSIGRGCDASGNCRCRPGITGKDCSQCAPRHIVSETGCISCEDGCVNVLLDEVEDMIKQVTSVDVDGHIPSPWPTLGKIKNETAVLSSQLDRYESRVDVSQEMLLNFEMDTVARILLRRAERLDKRARENLFPSKEIRENAQTILNNLLGLRFILEDSLSYLENYATGETPTISVTAALDEAERILGEVKMRDFDEFDEKAQTELMRSKRLLERVQLMQQSGKKVDNLASRFKDMDTKVDDLIKRIRDSKRTISETQNLDNDLKRRINRIRTILDDVAGFHLYTEDHNFNASRMVKRAERNIKNTNRNFNIIIDMMEDLSNKSSALSEFEAMLWQLNNAYKDNYVKKAEDHALHLKAQAIKLEKLFNKTRDVADGPLRAAEAYQRIVDALLSAEEAARNASDAAMKAYKVAYPGDPDESLVRRSKHSLEISKDLRSKGDGLQQRVNQLSKALHKQRRDLENTAEIVADSNRRLDLADNKLDTQFSSDISKDIKEALDKVEETEEGIGRTLFLVESIHQNLTKIKSYTKQISDLDSSLFQGISDTIADIEGTTMKGERLSVNLMRQSTRIEMRGNNLRKKIDAIKKRIEQTRQYASSIRVSLTTDENGICTRKYRPFLQPSTTSRLTLGYAINSHHKDALLLFMSSSNVTDFMAVEMLDRKIHFTWNAGGGSKTIIHPLPLETNNPLASDETKWYHITINRIGNIGELSVRPAFIKNSSRKKLYHEPVTGASPAGFSRMDLQPWDFTWIGGAPERSLSYLKVHDFKGCLHYVTIDGEPLGLWNFTDSIGCDACNEGFELQTRDEDKTAFGFNGKGYFKGRNKIRRPKPFYSVVLSFRSLDEDALLFLASNEEQNQYFSIGLKDGRVIFTVQFDHQTQLVMKSEKKLNNMKELIQIQADVQISLRNGIRMGKLVVGDQNQLATIKGGPDLNLIHQPFYFGGVDPEFNREVIGKQLELRSLLGCMGSLSVLEIGKNPHTDGQFYGIDKTCPKQPHSDVGFLGQSFLEMPSRVLRRDSNFGFTFKTMESDALLMVSTFVGQDEEELTTTTTTTTTTTLPPTRGGLPNPPDYYSVALVEGHLDLRLYAGSQRHRLMSRDRYNDGRLHSFFVIKENRKVKLLVDDQIVNSTRLDKGSHVVEAPTEGGLFFGGVPRDINVGSMVGSSQPLKGCIQDVIINNMVLPFNEPIRFENAFIGRCADLPRNAMAGMESDMKHIVSCQPPKQHTVEYGALKFGDQTESHAVVPLDKNTFKSDFEISFEFRTYYPSGLFFIAFNQKINRRGRKKLHLISTQLRNGRLQITIKNNRKEKKIISPMAGLNSGEWKKIILQKTRRKLRVVIDGTIVNKEKIPKKHRFGNKLFIGSLPFGLANASDISIHEPFRGCFRNLIINNEKYEIPSIVRQDHIVGVGQCFASVQPGSYFPGDAYALYDDNFQVGPLLELRLEFRTWELNGVLLSVADPVNDIALSLELDNGAVVLAVNVGHSHPFNARVTLPNIFSLCDNQWHTVKAHYIKDSLTLRVDSYPEAYGFNGSNNLRKTLTEAPLYLGGIPDSAPSGTLTGRENFKGCIRNIVLNSERRDWTDMYKLHHVLLNACPIL